MKHELTVQRETEAADLPSDQQFQAWVDAALQTQDGPCSVVVRIVDESESRLLNRDYRGLDRPTNVLAFPADIPETLVGQLEARPLGDVVICAPRVRTEADAQGKPLSHHWAHLTVHGVLHLLGHDHQDEPSAQRMEALEQDILAGFGMPDPYQAR